MQRNRKNVFDCNRQKYKILVSHMRGHMGFWEFLCLQIVIFDSLSQHLEKLTSESLKMIGGASTLFFLAASLTIASASSTRPWVISHRGDSGMNLHNQIGVY